MEWVYRQPSRYGLVERASDGVGCHLNCAAVTLENSLGDIRDELFCGVLFCQMLRLAAGNVYVETTILRCIDGTIQCVNVAGEEGFAFLGRHVADAIEVPKTGNVKVEIRLSR